MVKDKVVVYKVMGLTKEKIIQLFRSVAEVDIYGKKMFTVSEADDQPQESKCFFDQLYRRGTKYARVYDFSVLSMEYVYKYDFRKPAERFDLIKLEGSCTVAYMNKDGLTCLDEFLYIERPEDCYYVVTFEAFVNTRTENGTIFCSFFNETFVDEKFAFEVIRAHD